MWYLFQCSPYSLAVYSVIACSAFSFQLPSISNKPLQLVAPFSGVRYRPHFIAETVSFENGIAYEQEFEKKREKVAVQDEWIVSLDHEAFKKEIMDLGKRIEKNQGVDDVAHLQKLCFWSNACAIVGLSTMWLSVNPLSIIALSLWTFSRWTMIAHHTGHGGYNRADETGYFNSRGFAQGSLFKRATEWFDWMLPEAWNIEHNNLHHYRLGEIDDPDLVERNLQFVRELKAPMAVKYGIVFFLMCTWKWFYYAPNTYKELKIAEMRKAGTPITKAMRPSDAFTIKAFVDNMWNKNAMQWYSFKDLIMNVLGPYLVFHFILLPLPTLFISQQSFIYSCLNLIAAEILTNIHSFVVISTNHAGKDLYKFDAGCIPNSSTFFMRQIVSSTNFKTGGDLNDFLHGWLNYQIEHHVWPNLSALSYQRAAPELKSICLKFGVPYVQESVWTRLQKTVDIMVGNSNQRQFPSDLERGCDVKVWSNQDIAANSAALGQDI